MYFPSGPGGGTVAREKEVDNPNTKSERLFILTLILHVHKRPLDPFKGSNENTLQLRATDQQVQIPFSNPKLKIVNHVLKISRINN